MLSINCLICGKQLLSFPCRNRKFCSQKCYYTSLLNKPTWNKGTKGLYHISLKGKLAISKANMAQNNGMWKGDNAILQAIHMWVKRRKLKPTHCELCEQQTNFLDLANISQNYLRDLSDWEYLCRKCHMTKDGRLTKFLSYNKHRRCKNAV